MKLKKNLNILKTLKREINNFELVFNSTKIENFNTFLRIIFQDLDTSQVYILELVVDSVMQQILDDNHTRGTTNQLMNSIIRKYSHKSKLIKDIEILKEYIWNPHLLHKVQNLTRDIKINQIIK